MVIHQQQFINNYIYGILKKIGADLIPKIRFNILRFLYDLQATEMNSYWLKTTEISEGTEIHGKTALRALQDLAIIGLVCGRLAETDQGKPYE